MLGRRMSVTPVARNVDLKSGMTLTRLLLVAAVSFMLAVCISACQVVAGFYQPSLVRVIDASYIAPPVDIYVQSTIFAGNVGEGYISNYGTTAPSNDALVQVKTVSGDTTLVSASATLAPGAQHSVFLTDNGSTPTLYNVTALEDATTPAPAGNVEFRFLNQAPRTGALDVYMVPSGNTVANSIPICSDIPVGQACGYVTFAAQSVTMVITPTGVTTPKYTSQTLSLTGGQVRTVVMVDSQLTSDPPVNVVIADDVD
jgi:hypothetical protein